MKLYAASFSTILWRFYLMMAIGIVAIMTGTHVLGILCLPLLLMCLTGASFKPQAALNTSSSRTIEHGFSMKQEAA